MGAPGKWRPAIVALSKPKASAPRLHQSNRSHQPTRVPKPISGVGAGRTGKAVLTRSVRGDGRALSAMGTGICSQLPAGQSGLGGCPKTKPPDGDARGSCHSADCFGASPVASALGMEHRRDPALHSHYPTTASRATRPKPDISTWQGIGHFYLALTVWWRRLRAELRGTFPAWRRAFALGTASCSRRDENGNLS